MALYQAAAVGWSALLFMPVIIIHFLIFVESCNYNFVKKISLAIIEVTSNDIIAGNNKNILKRLMDIFVLGLEVKTKYVYFNVTHLPIFDVKWLFSQSRSSYQISRFDDVIFLIIC